MFKWALKTLKYFKFDGGGKEFTIKGSDAGRIVIRRGREKGIINGWIRKSYKRLVL